MADLKEHVVVITGATGALGSRVVDAFLKAGARVIGISKTRGESGGQFHSIEGDLSTPNGALSAFSAAIETHGQVDSLIHLAGGYEGGQKLAETGAASFDRMFDLNVRTAFHIIRAALPAMQSKGFGRIVLTASRSAIEPSPGSALYAASKAALVSLARSVAAEYAESGITVNAVLPGTMDTAANRASMPGADFSKWVNPDDVAALMVFLASAAGGSITGAAIPVYGAGIS